MPSLPMIPLRSPRAAVRFASTAAKRSAKTTPPPPLKFRPRVRHAEKPNTPPPKPPKQQQNGRGLSPRQIRVLIIFGLPWAIFGAYATVVAINLRRELRDDDATHTSSTVPLDVSDRYDRIAADFDRDVGAMEFWMGLNWRRRQLVRQARGEVLEVSVGTGRNMDYYPLSRCDRITMVEQSAPMMEIARQKWMRSPPHRVVPTEWRVQSALDPIAPPPGADGFDTVVQTMGLCSTPDPVGLLRNLGRVTKEDGVILLLEHGRSYYDWLNRILDRAAPAHADRFGCWWNKDIGQLVRESGLEVVRIKRYHLGTTWRIELRPPKKTDSEGEKEGKERVEDKAR